MTINTQSLREQIYQHFRDAMHNGELAPGAAINLKAISETLGISKTPLRDALIQLEAEGFVSILPRKGVVVNRLTLREVREFYDIIGALEAMVIRRVADRLAPADLDRLAEINTAQRSAFAAGEYIHYYQLNLDFHDVVLEKGANATLRRTILPMKQRLYDFPRQRYLEDWESANMDDHDRFIARLRAGDGNGAAALMQDKHWSFSHYEHAIRRFYQGIIE